MNDFLALADKGLGELEEGLDAVGKYVSMFVETERGSSLGLAKILHGVNFLWKDIEKEDGDTFKDWAMRSSGLAKATIQRRICSWEFITEHLPPEHYEALMKNWNINMLSRGYRVAVKHSENKYVGNYDYLPSGHEIEPADWLALSECVDLPMLIGVLDKITGKEPNVNRTSFTENDGTIWFHRGSKDSVSIGSFNVYSDSPLVQDGISEALDKLGIK